MMIIKTKKDAKLFINRIAIYMLMKGINTISKLRLVRISQDGNVWIGHCNHNVMKVCRTDDEIVDFVYKHRKEFNVMDNQLVDIEWDELDKFANKYPEVIKDGIVDIYGYITVEEEIVEMIQDYDSRLKLAYEKTGDERVKVLLESSWDEDDVCELLAELEGWD